MNTLRGRNKRVFDLLLSRHGKVVSHLAIMEAMNRKLADKPDPSNISECFSKIRNGLKGTPYEGRITNIKGVGFILDLPEETKAAA